MSTITSSCDLQPERGNAACYKKFSHQPTENVSNIFMVFLDVISTAINNKRKIVLRILYLIALLVQSPAPASFIKSPKIPIDEKNDAPQPKQQRNPPGAARPGGKRIIWLKAHMPIDGCRKIVDVFNRTYSETKGVTLGKNYVYQILISHSYEMVYCAKRLNIANQN